MGSVLFGAENGAWRRILKCYSEAIEGTRSPYKLYAKQMKAYNRRKGDTSCQNQEKKLKKRTCSKDSPEVSKKSWRSKIESGHEEEKSRCYGLTALTWTQNSLLCINGRTKRNRLKELVCRPGSGVIRNESGSAHSCRMGLTAGKGVAPKGSAPGSRH